jgi:hypothetical protein
MSRTELTRRTKKLKGLNVKFYRRSADLCTRYLIDYYKLQNGECIMIELVSGDISVTKLNIKEE